MSLYLQLMQKKQFMQTYVIWLYTVSKFGDIHCEKDFDNSKQMFMVTDTRWQITSQVV